MGGLGRPGNLVRGMAILEREGVESVSCDGDEFHIKMKSGEYKDVSTDDKEFADFYLGNTQTKQKFEPFGDPNGTTFNVNYKPRETRPEKKYKSISMIQRFPLDCTDEQFERTKTFILGQHRIAFSQIDEKIVTIVKNTDTDLMIVLNYDRMV
jgi:hypothetical protein